MKLPSLALNMQTFMWSLAIVGVLSLSIGAGSIWYVRGLQIDAIKSAHATQVAKMETKVAKAEGATSELKLSFEHELEQKRNELDQKYDSRVAVVNASVSKLSTIRLRDPSSNSTPGPSGNQGNTQGDNGSNSGELSYETSRFLWSFAGDADVVRERLAICKAWNTELEAQSQKYYDEIQELKKKLK